MPDAKDKTLITVGKTTVLAQPGGMDITITRPFDLRPEQLWRGLTDPALIPLWCGAPDRPNTAVDQMDLRPGGLWRWRFLDPQGNGMAVFGVYHDVVAPQRLVYTFEYEGVPGHVLLRTVTLEPRGDQTLLTEQSVFQSTANRDGMMQSGIKEATAAGWDRLENLRFTISD